MRNFPRRVRFALVVVALQALLLVLLRLIFLAYFSDTTSPLEPELARQGFYLGWKFDARLSMLMVLPVLLLSWLPGLNIVKSRFGRRVWIGYLTLAWVFVTAAYLVDFGHYAYLQTRINATVLEFLGSPLISGRMVWESYPVVWGALGLLLLGVVTWYLLRFVAAVTLDSESRPAPWWRRALVTLVFAGLVVGGLYGKWAYYPLRWSEAYFTPHPLAVALGLNPVLYFFDTASIPKQDFDKAAAQRYYPAVAKYFGVQSPDPERLNFERQITPPARVKGSPNVVVVILESFAAFKVGAFGNPLHPTPNFDALAQDGWLFRKFFVPSTGTARSVFCALFGIPDVAVNTTSTFNPFVVDQRTIINALTGYEKMYFLGGSANWRNIRGVLSHNIPGLRIYEEGDYASPRNDVWGISDLNLMEEANRVLRAKRDTPFFAVIQTAGNHRPYTIPEYRAGFDLVDPGVKDYAPHGFDSLAEYNSFRFLDHALGHLFRLARKEKYFDNTIFVVFGDHGLPGYPQHLPPGMAKHQLVQHHVPLLFYGPKVLGKSRVVETVASEMDVLPTLAGLLGKPYLNATLGRDVLALDGRGPHYAFILMHHQNPAPVGVVDEEFYYVLGADRRAKMFRYLSDRPEADVRDAFPDRARDMEQMALGLYESARYLLYHNGAAPPVQ